MKRALILLVILHVAACATTPANMQDAATSWLGASYDEAVARWGTPTRSSALSDGREAYTWVSESTTSRASIWPSIGIFGGTDGVGVGAGATVGPGGVGLVRCERTLIIRQGRVIDQMWQGDPAYCSTFARN